MGVTLPPGFTRVAKSSEALTGPGVQGVKGQWPRSSTPGPVNLLEATAGRGICPPAGPSRSSELSREDDPACFIWGVSKFRFYSPVFCVILLKMYFFESSCHSAAEMNLTRNQEVSGSIPGLARGLRIQCCCELWCRLQTQLGSGVSVALAKASGCSSN